MRGRHFTARAVRLTISVVTVAVTIRPACSLINPWLQKAETRGVNVARVGFSAQLLRVLYVCSSVSDTTSIPEKKYLR